MTALVLLLGAVQEDASIVAVRRATELVEKLGHDDPAVRDGAQRELRKMGDGIEPALRENPYLADPEVAARCGDLILAIERRREEANRIVRSKVVHISVEHNFIVIGAGRREGVKPGMRFEVLREVWGAEGAAIATRAVAKAVFEKHLGQETMSKLTMVEGKATDVKLDDLAVTRPLPPSSPSDKAK